MATTAIDISSGLIPHTDRDALHRSAHRESLVQQAKDHAQQFEDGLKAATRGIAGARFDSVRDEKDPERLDEKIHEEGQPVHTIPDILAGRISVDTPEAHERTADAVRNHFKIVRDVDEFEDGDPESGYRVHKLQVQVTPQLSAEVHIVPREVLDANEKQHVDYEAARDAELDGKEDLAAKKMKRAKRINDDAMAAFNARNGVDESKTEEKGGRGESPEPAYRAGLKPRPDAESSVFSTSIDVKKQEEPEHKYKFGSTQVNLPASSDAHKAILAAQKTIDPDHLANDGTDEEADKPHVTVRYGLNSPATDKLRNFIKGQNPFTAKLGKTAGFPPTEHSDGAVPIHATVDSPELHKLNAEIEKHGDFAPSSFPEYKPHVTVAYVKPEHASQYLGNTITEGKTFPVKSIAISDRDGNHEEVSLQGPLKKGDTVRLKDGQRAKVAYVPPPGAAIAIYRLTTDKGKPLTLKAKDVNRGAAKKVGEDDGKWIGVDLDGTLANYTKFKGPTVIGSPVPAMVAHVKQWIAEGKDVRIFTARVADDKSGKAREAIQKWSLEHIGEKLPITNVKDHKMQSLYDDRAVQVGRNTGELLGKPEKAMEV